jgi:CVNH domain
MRSIIALGVAVLGLALGSGIRSAAQAPGGSYQQTCRNIGVRGNTLYADCQDANRNWRSTQLRDYNRCRGEIQNINGNLQCTGGNDGRGPGRYNRDHDQNQDRDWDWDRDRRNRIPRGSYVQTCQDIRVNGNQLQARCQKKNGKLRDTSMSNFYGCRDIENDNGKLKCR